MGQMQVRTFAMRRHQAEVQADRMEASSSPMSAEECFGLVRLNMTRRAARQSA